MILMDPGPLCHNPAVVWANCQSYSAVGGFGGDHA